MNDKKTVFISNNWLPFLSCLFGCVELCIALNVSKYENSIRILFPTVVSLLIWGASICVDSRRNKGKNVNSFSAFEAAAIFGLFLLIGYKCIVLNWTSGYMSLNPIPAVDYGWAHRDTLFHSAFSEGYSQCFPSTPLVNGIGSYPYHTFSHLLIWTISKLIQEPAYLVYNYLYGVIFIPVYLFSQLFAIAKAKKYFVGNESFYCSDYLVVCLLNIGIGRIEDHCGIWRSSYIVSQSFLIAMTILFLFFGIAFMYLRKENKTVFAAIIVPLFIIFASWAKISVGVILTGIAMYYLFRTGMTKSRNWIMIFLYGIVFLCSALLASEVMVTDSQVSQTAAFNSFAFLPFRQYCSRTITYGLHFLILLWPTILFFLVELVNIFQKKRNGDFWLDLLAVCAIVCFLPEIFVDIPGGSAVYFSYIVVAPGAVLLCGNNCITMKECKYRNLVTGITALCCAVSCYSTIGITLPHREASEIERGGLYDELMGIRQIVQKNPSEYVLYVDSDVRVGWFDNSIAQIYVYPALTGAMMINASYNQDGSCYSFKDEIVKDYCLESTGDGKLDYASAVAAARELQKHYLIHVTASGYQVVEL